MFSLTSREPWEYVVVMTNEIMLGLNYKPNVFCVDASEKNTIKICVKMEIISIHPDSGQN